MRVVRTLEDADDLDGAADEVKSLLRLAHTPEAIGVCYYRLAFLLWQSGDAFAAEACYRASLAWPSTMGMQAMVELHTLLAAEGPQLCDGAADEPDGETVVEALRACEIPVAPGDEVLAALSEGARAAMDEGMFPVAKALSLALAGLLRDDVVYSVANSLEGAPDRL